MIGIALDTGATQFIEDNAGRMLAVSFALASVGAATGWLPGTRRRTSPAATASTADPALPTRSFGVRDGIAAFAWVFAAQMAVFLGLAIVAALEAGSGPPDALNRRVAELMPMAFVLANSVGAIALFLLFRGYARRADWPVIRDSFCLTWGTRSENALALLFGVLLAFAFLVVATLVVPPDTANPTNMGRMVQRPEGPAAFATIAVLLAPPTEELLFRGVLLRGLASRLSLAAAGFLSAALFWMIHLPETRHYWPAGIAIALLAALVTYLRIAKRAIGPAISGHTGYNLIMAAAVLAGSA